MLSPDPTLVPRLNAASARRRFYPYDSKHIDWSVPLSDTWLYMPESISLMRKSPGFDARPQPEQAFLTRWEITQLLRNIAHGEHLLCQAFMSSLWDISQYDPAFRYTLHEVAEECQHMAMFSEWLRLNNDLRTYGIGEVNKRFGVGASMLTAIAPITTEGMMLLVLAFEVFGEVINKGLGYDKSGRLHPILRGMGRVHVIEEARHIAYARDHLARRLTEIHPLRVRAMRAFSRLLARSMRNNPMPLPLPYAPEIAGLITREDFMAGKHHPERRRSLMAGVDDTIDVLRDLSLVS